MLPERTGLQENKQVIGLDLTRIHHFREHWARWTWRHFLTISSAWIFQRALSPMCWYRWQGFCYVHGMTEGAPPCQVTLSSLSQTSGQWSRAQPWSLGRPWMTCCWMAKSRQTGVRLLLWGLRLRLWGFLLTVWPLRPSNCLLDVNCRLIGSKTEWQPNVWMVTAPPVDFSRRDANSQCMLQRQLGNVGYMPGSGIVYLLQCALVACSSQWPGSIAGSIVWFVQFFIHSHAEIARGMEIMRR